MKTLSNLLLVGGGACLLVWGGVVRLEGADWTTTGDAELDLYFAAETDRLRGECLAAPILPEEWGAWQARHRRELFEMLGMDPLPERTDLRAVVTGREEREDYWVETLHFQSMPGLYVTANLYMPRPLEGRVPAILYGSGHARVARDGISYGNKVHYQHHGIWFARHGYACLVLDTVQLGEIEGIHHGTYREGMWWWNSRGFTSAGVEAWNCLRALDYLCARSEVDADRVGVTGRSGGGAYSWWVAALDERIKVAAPVAGITDLVNHVEDGTVEGHCDCMFMVNTYRWDYPQVAALVAPRPLLIVNTDRDAIFPLDGVMRTHAKVLRVYEALGARDRLGLVIAPGPHRDTQALRVPVLHWFNRHLKGEDPLIRRTAEAGFEPEHLRVFSSLPGDERTSRIHETFTPAALRPELPDHAGAWAEQREAWMEGLREKCFGGWPEEGAGLELKRLAAVHRHGLRLEIFEYTSQPHTRLRMYRLSPEMEKALEPVEVIVMGDGTRGSDYAPGAGRDLAQVMREERGGRVPTYRHWLAMMVAGYGGELAWEQSHETARTGVLEPDRERFDLWLKRVKEQGRPLIFLGGRGVGASAWTTEVRKQIQIRRRYMQVGQTLGGMRVWDMRRALQAIRTLHGAHPRPLVLNARGEEACHVLYASLFEPGWDRLRLEALPVSHREGPDYLNVMRVWDVPQALALALERGGVELSEVRAGDWSYAEEVAARLQWPVDRFSVR